LWVISELDARDTLKFCGQIENWVRLSKCSHGGRGCLSDPVIAI